VFVLDYYNCVLEIKYDDEHDNDDVCDRVATISILYLAFEVGYN